MEHSGKTFSSVSESIDGNTYTDCRFENCKMLYGGGELPRISGCHFDNCQWQFEGGAERTLIFMRQLYHGMGVGGIQLIEATLAQLRQPFAQPNQPDASPVPPAEA